MLVEILEERNVECQDGSFFMREQFFIFFIEGMFYHLHSNPVNLPSLILSCLNLATPTRMVFLSSICRASLQFMSRPLYHLSVYRFGSRELNV